MYLDRDDLVLFEKPLGTDPLHQVEKTRLALLHERSLQCGCNGMADPWFPRRSLLARNHPRRLARMHLHHRKLREWVQDGELLRVERW